MTEGYTYKIIFTNNDLFPWEWAVYLDGVLLNDSKYRDYTGSAMWAWSAGYGARKFIRRHRRHVGRVYNFD